MHISGRVHAIRESGPKLIFYDRSLNVYISTLYTCYKFQNIQRLF